MFIENIDIMIYFNNNKIVKTYQNGSLINKIDKVVSGSTPSSRLPSGYTEVEYIENTTSAYTETDFYPTQNTRVVAEMQANDITNNPRMFGAGAWNGLGFICNIESSNNQGFYYFKYGNTNTWYHTNVSADTNKHKFDLNKNQYYIDDVLAGTAATTSFTMSYHLGIFNAPNKTSGAGSFNNGEAFKGKCYSFKVYESDVLVRDLVPCINPSNVVGFYDVVNDVFYGSKNNVAFTAGSPITPSTAVTSESKTIFQYVTNGNEPTPPTPTETKLVATYTGGTTYTLACDSSSTLASGETRPTGYNYANMTDATIGGCVSVVGMNAFSGYTSLSSVTMASGVTAIGSDAFEACSGLTTVSIPNSVISIGAWAFNDCRSLTSVTIPDSVTTILHNAFNGCRAMTSVEIGSGITTIELQAFNYCSGLTGITINATTPPTLDAANVFSNTNNCPIYVPCDSVDAYKSANIWSTYASRIQAIPGSCSSRLPSGYTEVEYITSENVSESVLGPYIDTNYKPTQNTRVVIDYQSTSSTRNYQRIFGSGEFDLLGYLVNIEGEIGTSGYYYYKFGQSSNWYTTSVQTDLNRHIIDYNNSNQFLIDNTFIATLPNTTFTCTSNLGIFWSINTKYTTFNINFIGRIFSAKVYDDGTLIRDLVPCTNPNNVAGMYDIVNDAFYSSANSYNFTAGNPV